MPGLRLEAQADRAYRDLSIEARCLLADTQQNSRSDDNQPEGSEPIDGANNDLKKKRGPGHPLWDFWAPILFTMAL